MSTSQELHATSGFIQTRGDENASIIGALEVGEAELRTYIIGQASKTEILQVQVREQESESIYRIARNKVEDQREVELLEEKHFYELQAKDKAFQEPQNEEEKHEPLQSSHIAM
jgi:hypothetical protein